jgi:cephalosporin hydroxylase
MRKEFFEYLYNTYKPVQNLEEMWPFISEILNPLEPENIAEIGTESGASSLIWLSVNTKLGAKKKGFYIGLDSRIDRTKDLLTEKFRPEYFDLNFIEGSSQDNAIIENFKKVLNNKKLDFLFIDGSHVVQDVLNDIINYIPFVRKGGVVAFHDAGDPNGPKKAIEKAKEQGFIIPVREGLFNKTMGIYWYEK